MSGAWNGYGTCDEDGRIPAECDRADCDEMLARVAALEGALQELADFAERMGMYGKWTPIIKRARAVLAKGKP